MKRKILIASALALMVCILITLTGCQSKRTLSEVKQYEEDTWYADPNSGFGSLDNDDEKAVYVILRNAIFDHSDESQNVEKYKVSSQQLDKIWSAINQDNPEIFWIETFEYINSFRGVVERVTPIYSHTLTERNQMQAEIDSFVGTLNTYVKDEMDDFTKIKNIHDMLIIATKYNTSAQDNQTIYSVFAKHESVCTGYSRAFQYMLKKHRIYCTLVTGTQISDGTAHCWNIVKIDGGYYYFDVTSDDGGHSSDLNEENLRHTFFAVTSEEISRYHQADTTFITHPQFTDTQYNYYVHESLNFMNVDQMLYSMDQVIENKGTSFEAKLPDTATLEEALSRVQSRYNGRVQQISYSMTDKIPTLTFFISYAT